MPEHGARERDGSGHTEDFFHGGDSLADQSIARVTETMIPAFLEELSKLDIGQRIRFDDVVEFIVHLEKFEDPDAMPIPGSVTLGTATSLVDVELVF